MKKFFLPIVISITLIIACNRTGSNKVTVKDTVFLYDTIRQPIVVYDYEIEPDPNAVLVADSVIYSVEIQNLNPDSYWDQYRLRKVDKNKLVELIFQDIYNHKLIPYSYRDWIYGDKVAISIDSVKNWEKIIGKDKIAKIEFVERWFYSPKNTKFYKQVLEITLGYAVYSQSIGEYKFYPVFKISFDPNDNTIQ